MGGDDYDRHEVLDRTYVALDHFHEYVIGHRWVESLAQDDEVRHALFAAGEALGAAYNALGKRHLQ